VQRLITAADDTARSPLAITPQWPQAHEQAGTDLGLLDRRGALTRDLREVLTHHLLFLFNRLGISAADTWLLATAAVTVTFHHPFDTHPAINPPPRSEVGSTQ